jgi:hypothetical protein
MTTHEMERWPDAEIAFTIHYEGGEIKAHALTTIEAAEGFAYTIGLACVDAKVAREVRGDPEWPKERMRDRVMFVHCVCGKLYRLGVFLYGCDPEQRGAYICPACGHDVDELDEDPVPFDEGWGQESTALLPRFAQRHGEGIHTYYTGKDGKRLTDR